MMFLRVFLSLWLLQFQTATAQNKVWVRAYETPFEDFEVFLKSSSRLSYAEFQLAHLRKQTQKFQLKEKLISAQKLYLAGKKKRAMKFFNQITKVAYSANWSKDDRRIILFAFLRSAQIQEEEEKAEAFLILARNFHGQALSKETYSDFDLFSPPLMNQLKTIQEKNHFLSPDWKTLFPNHEIVLINGQRIEKDKIKKLLPVNYRVTALSSSHRAWSQKIPLSQLLLKSIQTEKLSSGFCEKISLIPELKKQKRFRLFSIPNCKSSEDLVWTGETLKQESKEKEMEQNLELSQKLNLNQTLDSEKGGEDFEKDKKRSHLPAWLLIGAGILTLSLILSLGGGDKEPEEDYVY